MATLSKGYTFGATETVTNTKLHDLVDLGSISGIVDADVSASANIASTKLDLSSAGYLTTGGDFDVTGTYSFSDLSWMAVGSLASINTARVQSMMLTSLASIAEGRVSVAHLDTLAVASLASLSNVQANVAYLYSLASIANPLHYSAISGSLASGAIARYDGTSLFQGAGLIEDLAASLSNVIFCWSGVDNASANTQGLYVGTATTPSIDSSTMNNMFIACDSATYQTMLNFQFTKIAGISTITIHARMWADTTGSGAEALMRVNVGGQTNTVKSVTSNTPTWVTTSTIDVSGLSDGTTYDGIVELANEQAGSDAYCSAVILIGS